MVSYRSPKPMFGVRNPAGVQNKSYQYLTLFKKGVYLLENYNNTENANIKYDTIINRSGG